MFVSRLSDSLHDSLSEVISDSGHPLLSVHVDSSLERPSTPPFPDPAKCSPFHQPSASPCPLSSPSRSSPQADLATSPTRISPTAQTAQPLVLQSSQPLFGSSTPFGRVHHSPLSSSPKSRMPLPDLRAFDTLATFSQRRPKRKLQPPETPRKTPKSRTSSTALTPLRAGGSPVEFRQPADIKTHSPGGSERVFEVQSQLGEGSFGRVYKVLGRHDGSLCAIKASKKPYRGSSDRENKLREVNEALRLPKHKNLLEYLGFWEDEEAGFLFILVELCDNGSLSDELDRCLFDYGSGLPEARVWSALYELASGLDHLHSNGLIHLDVKPENIFIAADGTLKIGDFGLVTSHSHWNGEMGDSRYMAAELFNEGMVPTNAADIFSLGVTIFELMTNFEIPKNGSTWTLLRDGHISDLLPRDRYSLQLRSLVESMLSREPSKRPTAARLVDCCRKYVAPSESQPPRNSPPLVNCKQLHSGDVADKWPLDTLTSDAGGVPKSGSRRNLLHDFDQLNG